MIAFVKSVVRPLGLERFALARWINRVFLEPFMPVEAEWMAELAARLIQPGDVFVDVGANEGVVSLRARDAGAVVVAFEPNLRLARKLRMADVETYGIALSNVQSYGVLHQAEENTGVSSLRRGAVDASIAALKTDLTVRPLVTVVDTLDHFNLNPSILKIDAQGGDYDVLVGARETIRRARPVILVEVWPNGLAAFGAAPEDIEDFLREHHYTWTILRGGEDWYDLLALPEDQP